MRALRTGLAVILVVVAALSSAQISPTVQWREVSTYGDVGLGPISSPDQQSLVHGDSGELLVRNTSDLRLRHRIVAPSSFRWMTISQNSRYLIAGSTYYAWVYDLQTGALSSQFWILDGSNLACTGQNAFGEEMLILASNTMAEVYVFDGAGWSFVIGLTGFNFIESMRVSPNQRWLSVLDSVSDNLKVFDLTHLTNNPVAIRSVTNGISQCFSFNSAQLFVGTSNGSSSAVIPWSTSNWASGTSFTCPAEVRSIEMTYDGSPLWLGTSARLQRRLTTGTVQFQTALLNWSPNSIAQAPTGRVFFDGNGRWCNFLNPEPNIGVTPGSSRNISALAVAASGTQLLTGSVASDGQVRALTPAGLTQWGMVPDGTSVDGLVYTPDSSKFAVASSDSATGKVKVYSTVGVQLNPAPITQTNAPGKAIAFSPVLPVHGQVLAIGNGIQVRLLKLSDYAFLGQTLNGNTGWTSAVAFSKDGSRVAVGSDSGEVSIYKTTDWSLVKKVLMTGEILKLSFDSTGTFLYALSNSSTDALRSIIKTSVLGNEDWLFYRTVDAESYVGTPSSGALSRDGRIYVVTGNVNTAFFYAGSLTLSLGWLAGADSFSNIDFSATNHDLIATAGQEVICLKNPYPTFVSTLSLSPTAVNKGQSSTLTVNLTKSAPVGGVTVALTDYTTSVLTPVSVFVPAGQYTATTTLNTVAASRAGTYTITAKLFGVSVNTQLTINP